MSARTCQLCGKPLSRIWVGAGGDFCSREHRNQFGLRRGMDRLQEANQVATLIRRREALKPVATDCVESVVPPDSHGFFDPQRREITPPHSHATAGPGLPAKFELISQRRLLPTTFVTGSMGSRGKRPRVRPGSLGPAKFLKERRPELRPPAKVRLSAALERATSTRVDCSAVTAEHEKRDCQLLRKKSRTAHFDLLIPRRSDEAGLSAAAAKARPSAVETHPQSGLAMRVSAAKGFRPARPELRTLNVGKSSAELIWPRRLLNGFPSGIDRPSAVRALEKRVVPKGLCLPEHPSPTGAHGLVWPGFDVFRPHGEFDREHNSRATGIVWDFGDRAAVARVVDLVVTAKRCWDGGPPHKLPQRMIQDCDAPQIALVRFEPAEAGLDYSPIHLEVATFQAPVPQGSSWGGPTPEGEPEETNGPAADKTSGPTLVRAQVRLEENFESTLSNWVGDLDKWTIDAAGARIGSLALFVPSIDLVDYEFEFLARVENRTLTWLFRAEELNDYHAASLEAIPEGGFTFNRWSVIGGVEGGKVSRPVALPNQPAPGRGARKAKALTISTRVSGDRYTVTVDGEPIDEWADDRLHAGGIGFIGTADDRARLYWIHLTSPAIPGKENHP